MPGTGANVLKGLSTIFGAIWVLEGIRSVLRPEEAQLADFGFSTATAAKGTTGVLPAFNNPWIPLTHSRTATMGLIVLHLAYLRNWRAIGLTFMYGTIVGFTDGYYAYLHGGSGKGLEHAIPTLVLGATGFLLQYV